MKVFIVGSGAWGTALANVLADNGHQAMIYGRNPKTVEEINTQHTNTKYFSCKINENVRATNDISECAGYDTVMLGVPSRECLNITKQIKPYLTEGTVILNIAKGFEPESYRLLSDCVSEELEYKYPYAALLGPSLADEVILHKHTAVNVCCQDEDVARKLQEAFSNEYFRVYRNSDLIGCQYGCGLKNIIAIASGILYGLDLGDNAKASLVTRGLAEITRLGVMMGGKKETFMGLCGMGDLIVTCTSSLSRNWQAGYTIGKNDDAKVFWDTNTKTVEGVDACRIIYNRSRMENISMPITEELYRILFEGCRPSEAASRLMKRALKPE